jgi:glyoxylate/hydroxypyruvate reductase A
MVIVFYSLSDEPGPWREALRRALPEADFRVWPEVGDPREIEYALVWKPPPGWLKQFPRLKAILSLGAGVDHLFLDPELPRGLPITRMVDAGLADQMSEYALYGVLHFHRDMGPYAQQQRRALWKQLQAVPATARTVGVMGVGVLGSDFVRKLLPLKFPVVTWSRTPHQLPGVEAFHGRDALRAFLGRSHILVNFLPLTAQTAGLLHAGTLAQLPSGACIVNLARGAHIVEADLLAALDSGHIGGALLDVFAQEPLPPQHPFWSHPKVLLTPHIGGQAIPELMVSQVVDNVRRIERGEAPFGLVDPARGY